MTRQESRRPGAGRAVWSLGTCCGTLAVAAVVSAVYPVPEPVLRSGGSPVSGRDDVLSALNDVWFPVDESEPVGGPLEPPMIGVGLPEFDAQMEALEAARETAPRPPVRTDDSPVPAPGRIEQPAPGELPGRSPDAPQLPPVAHEPPTPSPASPVTETPTTPTTPTPPPPVVPAPTTPPPTEEPPEEPPEPPLPPPGDATLAVGERYDHVDAEGTVLFSITLVRVDTALACTAPGALPAENGHLIGLHVEVDAPELPAEGEPPPVSAADFRFLDADEGLTTDVDTDSSAACLGDGVGTVVLDVPAVTGTVVYRPSSWPAGLRWGLVPSDQP